MFDSSQIRAALVGAVAAAALVGAASARAAMPGDLSGIWQMDRDAARTRPKPSLTPATQALIAKKNAARQAGLVRSTANLECLPTGMPEVMQWISPIYIFQDYHRVAIITENDPGADQPRMVYLDEKVHPDPATLDPTFNGHSIGHWEGPVLVVDTVGFNDRATLLGGVPRTPKAHIVEKFHVSADGQTMTDTMTMEDPTVLAAPWTVDLIYKRMPADTERLEAVCEADIDALNKLDLNAIKDVDSEAARLANPALRYNPGGK